MKSLHIIRNLDDQLACMAIRTSSSGEDALLLMQDGVYGEFQFDSVKIYACQEDLLARKIEKGYQPVSFQEIAEMIIEYDRTIVW
jgi:sulfur relay protein TusB/DsrH